MLYGISRTNQVISELVQFKNECQTLQCKCNCILLFSCEMVLVIQLSTLYKLNDSGFMGSMPWTRPGVESLTLF